MITAASMLLDMCRCNCIYAIAEGSCKNSKCTNVIELDEMNVIWKLGRKMTETDVRVGWRVGQKGKLRRARGSESSTMKEERMG